MAGKTAMISIRSDRFGCGLAQRKREIRVVDSRLSAAGSVHENNCIRREIGVGQCPLKPKQISIGRAP